jgi:hypothetical protein
MGISAKARCEPVGPDPKEPFENRIASKGTTAIEDGFPQRIAAPIARTQDSIRRMDRENVNGAVDDFWTKLGLSFSRQCGTIEENSHSGKGAHMRENESLRQAALKLKEAAERFLVGADDLSPAAIAKIADVLGKLNKLLTEELPAVDSQALWKPDLKGLTDEELETLYELARKLHID